MSDKPNNRKKWLTSFVTTVLLVVCMEFVLGIQASMHRRANGFQLDPELGWRASEKTQVSLTKSGYGTSTFSTGENGFRRYGDVDSSKPKVLVIGDSYTFADTVNDGEAYYDHLADNLNAEVFAYGCSGFGTLQELLILQRHFEAISPNLVVWQLCENDFVNNSFELESRDLLQNNFMVRPFRAGGDNVLSFPSQSGRWLLKNSYLARWVFRRVYGRGRKQFDYSNETNKSLAEQAIHTTAELLGEAKTHIGDVPLLVFCNRHGGLYADAIAKNVDCYFTLAVEQAIEAAVVDGKRVDARPRDLHWNADGHAVVADALLRAIAERNLVSRTSQ